MDALRKAGHDHVSKEKMANIRAKYDKLDEVDMEEGTTVKTKTGLKHSGSYGTEFQPDDTRDEYGHRVRGAPHVSGAKQKGSVPGKGRGRPTKADNDISSKDLPADAFGRTSGKIPAGKQGKIHTTNEGQDDLNRLLKLLGK